MGPVLRRTQEGRAVGRRGWRAGAERELHERRREAVRKGKAAAPCQVHRELGGDDESEEDEDLWEALPTFAPEVMGRNQGEAGPSGLCAKRRGQTVEARNVRQRSALWPHVRSFRDMPVAQPCPLGWETPLP